MAKRLPRIATIHQSHDKSVPPSGPFGVATSVSALAPNGTTSVACGVVIGSAPGLAASRAFGRAGTAEVDGIA